MRWQTLKKRMVSLANSFTGKDGYFSRKHWPLLHVVDGKLIASNGKSLIVIDKPTYFPVDGQFSVKSNELSLQGKSQLPDYKTVMPKDAKIPVRLSTRYFKTDIVRELTEQGIVIDYLGFADSFFSLIKFMNLKIGLSDITLHTDGPKKPIKLVIKNEFINTVITIVIMPYYVGKKNSTSMGK